MKLRQETINAITEELKPIQALIKLLNGTIHTTNITSAFNFFCGYYYDADEVDVVKDKAIDYRLADGCFDIVTPHTETTIYFEIDKLSLGSIEVWEDEELCGTWSLDDIINNKVEFNE